jgi:hypothetical protein
MYRTSRGDLSDPREPQVKVIAERRAVTYTNRDPLTGEAKISTGWEIVREEVYRPRDLEGFLATRKERK